MRNVKYIKIVSVVCCAFILCSFELQDIVLKNIELLPNIVDETNRIPNFIPDFVKNEKPEKLYEREKIKIPDIGSPEKPAEDVIKIKGFLKEHIFTTQDEIAKTFTPTADSIDNMFHLTDIGIKIPKGGGGEMPKMATLKDEAKNFPLINGFEGMEVYKSDNWIVENINDIQVVGIDAVMPKSVGAPLKAGDYDPQPIFDGTFPAGITPDDMLNTKVMDIIP